mmetsp:Transcript_39595/g.58795  ORF Transcript_39595/g.58795 Transcript_39595/m.58795 type:complete len:130 (-) Transcript_39595:44-433(-)
MPPHIIGFALSSSELKKKDGVEALDSSCKVVSVVGLIQQSSCNVVSRDGDECFGTNSIVARNPQQKVCLSLLASTTHFNCLLVTRSQDHCANIPVIGFAPNRELAVLTVDSLCVWWSASMPAASYWPQA